LKRRNSCRRRIVYAVVKKDKKKGRIRTAEDEKGIKLAGRRRRGKNR